jgi:hypothetical protein
VLHRVGGQVLDRTLVTCPSPRIRENIGASDTIAPTRHPPLEAIMESIPVRNVVLCVDDEEAVRCLLEFALEPFGYVALVASNGREALRLAAQRRVDAVYSRLRYARYEWRRGCAGDEASLRPDVSDHSVLRIYRTYHRAHSCTSMRWLQRARDCVPCLPCLHGCKFRGRNSEQFAGSHDFPARLSLGSHRGPCWQISDASRSFH